jgi:hypothetical protein
LILEQKAEADMGLFDWFGKPKNVPLPQLCYGVAYFVLPHYVYNDLAKLTDMCAKTPTSAGPFFYLMACQFQKAEPSKEDAVRFRWHCGILEEGREYFVLEYPTPLPVDLSDVSPEKMLGKEGPVLAPYFSAIIRETASGDVSYYVLGQAPLGGGTTLRSVLREGMNCNHGPGPEPKLDAFLSVLRKKGDDC